MTLSIFIFATSILLQFTAAFLAFRLIRITGWQWAWSLVAAALLLMGIRRGISFIQMLQSDVAPTTDAAELVALVISVLMVAGVAMIGPLFLSRQRDETRQHDLARMVEGSLNEIYIFDAVSLRFIDVNRSARENLGYTMAELERLTPIDIKPEFTLDTFHALIKPLQSGQQKQIVFETIHKRQDKTNYWAEVHLQKSTYAGKPVYSAIILDITEAKKKDEVIWSQANYDMLTGLPNRRLLYDRLEQEIKKARRNKLPLAVLFIDLDRFKEINDTMGHAKGDLLLKDAARRIGKLVRETDTVARLGGDEFTIILPGFGDRSQIERIARNIIAELSKPFYFENDENGYYISASIGITLYPDDAQEIGELLMQADQAMYKAKEEGRHRFNYFAESMQQEAQDKLALTHDLRQALVRQELHVYYQPIVELTSGRIVKSEALLRWIHPERGMVSPAIFIPLAEESGLIHEIGEWVFHESIVNIDRWRKQTGHIVPVSVNKSPIQFEYTVQQVTWLDKLASLNLPGASITVEITEGLLLKESPKIKQQLLDYRNSGIEVSIDDFGTGFSALSYLKRFDIDYLKIDRSFISKLAENESDRVLTEAIIVMAHKLGIQTIAEGVETSEQRIMLRSFGCDYAQGFLYSPAVPVEEFEKLLEQGAYSFGKDRHEVKTLKAR